MTRSARRERMASLLAEPSTFNKLILHVSGGGTMDEWSRGMDFVYGDVYAWVYDDRDRLAEYSKAMESHRHNLSDRVVTRLRKVMDQDIRPAFDKKGRPLPAHKLPDAVAEVMSGIDHTVDGRTGTETTRLRFTPRDRGMEMLGRHLGMFKDKLEVSGSLSLADRLSAARKRHAPKSESK